MAGPTDTEIHKFKSQQRAKRSTIGHMRICNLLTIRIERQGQRFLQALVVDDTLDRHILEQPRLEEQRAPHYRGAVTLTVS